MIKIFDSSGSSRKSFSIFGTLKPKDVSGVTLLKVYKKRKLVTKTKIKLIPIPKLTVALDKSRLRKNKKVKILIENEKGNICNKYFKPTYIFIRQFDSYGKKLNSIAFLKFSNNMPMKIHKEAKDLEIDLGLIYKKNGICIGTPQKVRISLDNDR
jgi:hypothetical protein